MRQSIKILGALASLVIGFSVVSWHFNPKAKLGSSDLPIELEVIARKLIATSGIKGEDINFIVIPNEVSLIGHVEYALNTIRISKKWLDLSIENYEDYRMNVVVLAHEIAHIMNNDTVDYSNPIQVRNNERMADYMATELIFKAGLGCGYAVGGLGSLEQLTRFKSFEDVEHPHGYERVESAKKNCKSLIETGKLPKDLYFETEIPEIDFNPILSWISSTKHNIRDWLKRVTQ